MTKVTKPLAGVKHIKRNNYFILISPKDKDIRYYDSVELSILRQLGLK